MSGFAMIVNHDGAVVERSHLEAMADVVRYRGPEGVRFEVRGNVGAVHLASSSTPPLEGRKQPLTTADGRYVLVGSIRLDNREELIKELARLAPVRSDATDSEVVLAAYHRWGAECADHLVGDFAFALWDAPAGRLYCATDPFGVQPLHYASPPGCFIVATEAQQVVQHPAVTPRLNEGAVAEYLANIATDDALTLFEGVSRLRGGHCIVADAARLEVRRYWNPDPGREIRYTRREEYAEHFLALMRRAVGDRLRNSGDAAGILVSGGLDSCSVAAVACNLTARRRAPLLTGYSWGFARLRECDERPYSERMTVECGLPVRYIPVEQQSLLPGPSSPFPDLESPFHWYPGCDAAIARHLRERDGHVLLTGHGGDVLLQGSQLVYADRLQRGDLRVFPDLVEHARRHGVSCPHTIYRHTVRPFFPSSMERALSSLRGHGATRRSPDWIAPEFARRTALEERSAAVSPLRVSRSRAWNVAYERCTQLGSVTRSVYWRDRAAARYGLEARHPFLDRRLAEFILAIPQDEIYRRGVTKAVLRDAVAGLLPEKIRQRVDKTGFRNLIRHTLCSHEREAVERLLEQPLLEKMGFVDARRMRDAYVAYREGRIDPLYGAKLSFALGLEHWLRRHWGSSPASSNAHYPAASAARDTYGKANLVGVK